MSDRLKRNLFTYNQRKGYGLVGDTKKAIAIVLKNNKPQKRYPF
ncbi:MAG: hypothetical protein ACPL1G_02960 [Thermodesulfovibrionales bacterium]